MFTTDVNYLAVLVSAIIYMVLGFIWYSPKVFGATWMECTGMREEDCKKCGVKCWIGSFILGLIISFVLTLFVYATHASTAGQGAMVGFWAWLGFVATTQYAPILYERKPCKLFMVCSGFMLIFLLIAGALLAVWQ